MLHAEMVAISLAQKGLGSLDLGAPQLPPHELVTSSEPCAMCYGALFWCGVRRLVCGARASDTEPAGSLDEGAKVENWQDELRQRGIDVVTDVHRDRTIAVLMGVPRPAALEMMSALLPENARALPGIGIGRALAEAPR